MNAGKMGTVLRLLGVGWYVAICIAGGGIAGLWLDQQLNVSPLLTILGVAVGIAAAVVGMYRMLIAILTITSGPDRERNN